jgi:hypothetical protein
MALTIRDLETERLADEVAELTRDSKTGAVRQALRERRERFEREAREKECRAKAELSPTKALLLVLAEFIRRCTERR